MTSGSVPRTMGVLRGRGDKCAVVERFNPHAGDHGKRQDLFGIADILVLDPARGFVGVQVCGTDFASHVRKLTEECAQETVDWLNTPGGFVELWGWRKLKKKRGGKALIWTPRIQEITLKDIMG